MKDSTEKEHHISHLKDLMEGVKETSEEKPDDADEIEEYEVVDADELIHELNAEEKQNFEEETFEIDDEFIYSPNKDSEEAEILEEIDEDFIITTEINDSETDYEEDVLYDSEDKISEQFNNIVHARVGNYPIMAVVSLAVGIILLIVSIFLLITQTSERVIDSVASGELNVIIVIAAFIGILLIIIGIYKLFSLKNPFGDLTKKIDNIEKEEKKTKKEPQIKEEEKKVIPKSKIPLNREDYKIGEFDISSIKTNFKESSSDIEEIKAIKSEKPTFNKTTSVDKEINEEEPTHKEEENIEPVKEEKEEKKTDNNKEDEEYKKAQLDNESIDEIFSGIEEIEEIPIISVNSKDKKSSDKKEE
ncbi:MAG: topoisomerase IV [Methanobrevibacter woesei]|nr:topoisomerase IV [Methanobrevibacter woesei]